MHHGKQQQHNVKDDGPQLIVVALQGEGHTS
jgi:hypothetical protein